MSGIWYDICSGVISTCFLTVLFILALWHNLISWFHKKDPRDIRGSKSAIKPRRELRRRSSSVNSETPFALTEFDEANNIEYDHTVTSGEAVGKDELPRTRSSEGGNPFADLLMAEDFRLVPRLGYYYEQYDLDFESFEVTTEDGFVIELWHLRSKSAGDKSSDKSDRHPVLLLHGLLQSSGSFASSGRKSLAYYLEEQGFDVWLGNNRCGFKPKWAHIEKDAHWDWDLKEMVKYDLPALVDEVLVKAGKPKISLVAHSQGTTQVFMGLVNGEALYDGSFRLIDKIENFVALAPAVYPGPLLDEKGFIRFMSRYVAKPWAFGRGSFLPLMSVMRKLMVGSKLFSFLSYVMFNYLFDWNDTLWDKPLRDRHFLFSPVVISVKLMRWWLGDGRNAPCFKNFAETTFPDSKTWFPVQSGPPKIQIENHLNIPRPTVTDFPRFLIFIPRQDRLVDGERLINHFIDHESHSLYKIWYIDEYSHLDVLWARDVVQRIGKPMVDNLRIPTL
ncbi:LAMI_0H08746g1_1 [Lachancea mirantina]|uniref:LAMI_0H08746g1_1 n=1 Tax=Lachancea mirantina TaxID=1230905 RepID=A0A1G4KG31_9SACH|nr:LAMI_0H08746g1_1 [Lachancea mirantina]